MTDHKDSTPFLGISTTGIAVVTRDAARITLLLGIANQAIEFVERQNDRRFKQDDLNAAYASWREDTGIHYRIERESDEWKQMMAATASEYEELSEAKRQETNAAKRLRYAVFKYRAEIDAERARSAGLEPMPKDARGENAEALALIHP